MICKICKKRNHRTSECFHKKNRVKNRKFSFQNKAPKITEAKNQAQTQNLCLENTI